MNYNFIFKHNVSLQHKPGLILV